MGCYRQVGIITIPRKPSLQNSGGVLSQLPQEASIVSTVATRHYGVSASSNYNEIEDAGQPRRYDRYEGCDRVTKMTWYIERVSSTIRNLPSNLKRIA